MPATNKEIIAQARADLARYIDSYAESIVFNAELARVIEEDRYSIGVEIAHFEKTADFDTFYESVMSFDTVVRDAFEQTALLVTERYFYEE
jgi:hypothetical protein